MSRHDEVRSVLSTSKLQFGGEVSTLSPDFGPLITE